MSFAASLLHNPLQTALSVATAKPRSTAATGTASTPTTGTGSASGAGTTSSSSTSLTSGTSDIGTTFLSLLVQELQNQDPTAPMDSTAMVGQMISLNQLDQLTNINQTLTGAYGGTSSTTSSSSLTSPTLANPGIQTATQAALNLLNSAPQAMHRAVSSSVTLPAF